MRTISDLKSALKLLFDRHGRWDDFVQESHTESTDEVRYRFSIFTSDHEYAISALLPEGSNDGYLGCVMCNRRPDAGEEHTRGSDLPDGKFSIETWESIRNAIIGFELVKLAPKREPMKDSVEAAEPVF